MKRLLVIFAVLTGAVYVGCKQGSGDRCQVDDDCESGTCNMSKGTCSTSNDQNGSADAEVPIQIDAAIDAPTDAMPDMM